MKGWQWCFYDMYSYVYKKHMSIEITEQWLQVATLVTVDMWYMELVYFGKEWVLLIDVWYLKYYFNLSATAL